MATGALGWWAGPRGVTPIPSIARSCSRTVSGSMQDPSCRERDLRDWVAPSGGPDTGPQTPKEGAPLEYVLQEAFAFIRSLASVCFSSSVGSRVARNPLLATASLSPRHFSYLGLDGILRNYLSFGGSHPDLPQTQSSGHPDSRDPVFVNTWPGPPLHAL